MSNRSREGRMTGICAEGDNKGAFIIVGFPAKACGASNQIEENWG